MYSLLKTTQNQKNIFFFIKLLLLLGVLFLLYKQLSKLDTAHWEQFHLTNTLSLLLAIAFVIPNIWLAWYKWKITVCVLNARMERSKVTQSFFAGIVTGMLTPNMLGNFIGRFYYFEKSERLKVTAFTMLSNFGQLIASLSFGWLSILILDELLLFDEVPHLKLWIGIVLLLCFITYFFGDLVLSKVSKNGFIKEVKSQLKHHQFYRFQLLFLSFLRLCIFTTQFMLVLNAFGEELSWFNMLSVWQVYLLTMLAPSLFLGKIGVRELISVTVLTSVGMNEFAVLFSSLIIWFVNSFAPALLGLVICRRKHD